MLKQKFSKITFLKIFSIKKKLKVFLLLCLSILTQLSCNTTEPTDELKPGRRDYIWTVDTLNYPFATLYRIWGSSPTDVWATSPGNWDKSISHFNGNRWTSYGVTGMNVPSSIFGFAPNSIFIGTGGGGIWKFDGNNWNKIAEITKDGRNDIVFDNIWGKAQNDLYAFGAYTDSNGLANNSVIARFRNNNWSIINNDEIKGIVEHLFENNVDGKIYFQSIKIGGFAHPDSTILYEYYNSHFAKIYSGVWDYENTGDISLILGEVYFIIGKRITKRVNNEFKTFLNLDNTNFDNYIWGLSSKNIFIRMTDGMAHYNGSNIEYLVNFSKPRTKIPGAILFDNEVFFIVYEASTNLNLIYHGKLD
jgi:hypothetical protein